MPAISRILCPVDFSEPSRHAIDHAVVIAGWYKAPIAALHVYNPVPPPVGGFDTAGYEPRTVPDPQAVNELRDAVRQSFASAVAAGVEVQTLIDHGSAASSIVDRARTLPADLIVMGTHGTGGFEHLLLGSVTEKVLRKARCPVMTVPPRARSTSRLPFKRLLCPIDFSESSRAALELAFSFAQEGDAELTLLHVIEWPPADEEPPSTWGLNVPEYRQYQEQDARSKLQKLVPDSVSQWCSPHTHIARGKPYREILGHAAEGGVDAIIMGVTGRSALDQTLFGSTTNQVVRRATCPVLTLRR